MVSPDSDEAKHEVGDCGYDDEADDGQVRRDCDLNDVEHDDRSYDEEEAAPELSQHCPGARGAASPRSRASSPRPPAPAAWRSRSPPAAACAARRASAETPCREGPSPRR